MAHRFPQETIDRVLELRKTKTITAVAKATGLKFDQVRNIIRANGNPEDVNAEPDGPTLDELARQVAEDRDQANRERMFRELLQQKSQTDRIIESIIDSIPRVPEVRVPRRPVEIVSDGQPQTAFLALSDTHVGAVADIEETGGFGEYNYVKFLERLHNLSDAVKSITHREQHFSKIERLVLALLGDLIENDSIFPAQQQMIDLDLSDQFLAAINDLAEFIVGLLDTFDSIFVPCVTGNHGRIGRKGERKRHANWDYLISKMLEAKLEGYSDRVQFEIPKAPFAVVNIEGHDFLLRHGDGIKSWGGIPYYGIARSVGRWTSIQATQNKRFEYMVIGHFHQPATIPYTGGEVLINGCFPGVTEFSVEVMESLNVPMQLFGFVHPRWGLGARYPILLDR